MADDINMTAEQLKQGMLSATSAMGNFTSKVKKTNQEYAGILEQLKKLNQNFKNEFESTADYLKQVVGAGGSGGSKKVIKTKDELMLRMMHKLVKCACKEEADINSFAEDIEKQMNDLVNATEKSTKVNNEILKETKRKSKRITAKTDPSFMPPKKPEATPKEKDESYMEKEAKLQIKRSILRFVQNSAKTFENVMFGMDEKMNMLTKEFNPVELMQQEQGFNREIRQTAFDIDNVTSKSKGMQKAFADIGKSVEETGVSRSKYQEAYIKNLKSGIKDLGFAQKLTKQTLGTERLLGLEAGSLSDHFRDIAQFGRLTAAETGAIGRGMVEVAKATGITGDRMKDVVGKSKQFTDQMVKAAQFTSASNKNIMEIVANAEKFGVGDSVGNILKVATSTNELISNSSSETSAFLYRAAAEMGRVQDLQYGIITRSKKGIKDLSLGMEKVLQRFGVESIEAVENLTDEQKFKLNIQLKAAYGMELGEVVRTIDTFKQSSKGAAEQLEEIAKKQKQNLNLEEKAALVEQQRRIKASTAMSVVTALSESAKGAKDMNQALEKFNRRKDEFSSDIKAIGGDLTNTTEGIGFAYKTAANELNAKLKELGKEPIKIDGKDIEKALKDKDAQALLAERLEKGFQTLQQAEKNAADPMTGTYQTLMQYSDFFRTSFAAPAITLLTGIMGQMGLMLVALGGLGIAGGAAGFDLKQEFGNAFREMGKVLPASITEGLEKIPGAGTFKKFFGMGDEESPVKKVEKKTYDLMDDDKESKPQKAEKKSKKGSDAKKASKGSGKMGKLIPDVDFKDITAQLKDLGKLLLGTVAAIAMIGVAIIAIGAIVQTVSKALKIDPLQLGLEVTKLMLAAAIIGTQVAIGFVAIDQFNRKFGKRLNPANAAKLWLLAKKLIIMTLAVVGLAMGLLFVTKLLTFGMSAKEAQTIAKNVLSIMVSAGTIILGLVAAAGIILGLGWALETLAGAEPEILGAAIFVGLVIIPMAFVIVGIAAALLKFSSWILGIAGLDSKTIAQTVINVNMVVWGFNSIVVGLALASLVMVETGILMTAIAGTLPGWKLALIGLGALVVVGIAIVAIMWALSWFMDKILSANLDGSLAKKSEAVIALLDAVNNVLLRLAPMFVLIIAGGVLMYFIMAAAPAVKAAAFAGIIAAGVLLILVPLIAMWLLTMYTAVAALAAAVTAKIDVATMKESIDKTIIMLDAVNGVLLRILPMFGMILLLAGVVALIAFLATSGFGWVAAGLAAGIVVFTVLLPTIIGLMIDIGVAIIEAAQAASAGFSFDESAAKELTDKVWLIQSTSMELAAAFLAMATSAAFFNGVIVIALLPLALLSVLIWSILGYFIIIIKAFHALDQMLSEVPFKEFMQMGFKIMMFANAMMFLNLALGNMAAMGVGGLFLILPLAGYSAFLSMAKGIIFKLIADFIEIGWYILIASVRLPFSKVNQGLEKIVEFTLNLNTFMEKMDEALPSSTIISDIFASFVTEKPADKVRRYINEIGEICNAALNANFKMEDLEGSVALFDTLARWAKLFSSSMVDLSTAQSTMTSTVFSDMTAIFKKDLKKEIEDRLQNVADIITAVNTKSSTFSPATSTNAVAYMEEMARVMKSFGAAMTSFAESMEAAGKMRSMLWMLEQKNAKGKAKDSELTKIVGRTLDGVNALMPVIVAKIPDDNNFDEAVARLESLAPAMKIFGEVMSSFGSTMQMMFQQTSWGFGKKGPGTFLVENQQTIQDGMKNIFTALGNIFTDLQTVLGPNLGKTAKVVARDLNTISKELGIINPALTNINKNLTSFLQAKKMAEQLQKTIGANAVKPDDSAQKLQMMSDMMGPLTGVFQQFSENMAPLTAKKGWFGFGTSVVDDVAAQAEEIGAAVKAVSKLVQAIVNALKIVPDVKAFEEVNVKMKLMSQMIENLGPILSNFGTSMSKLTSKSGKDKSLTEFVKELTDKLGDDDTIGQIFAVIYDKMVTPLMAENYNPQSIKEASQMLTDMGVLLDGLSTSLNIISTSLMKTVSLGTQGGKSLEGSLVKQVQQQLENSGVALGSIMGSLKTLIDNIWNVGPSREIKEAGEIIKGLAVVLDELAGSGSKPGLLTTLNGKIMALTKAGSSAEGKPPPKTKLQKAEEAIQGLTSSLKVIMPSMKSLIDAVWDVGPSSEVKEAAGIISGLTDLMNAVAGKPGQPGLIETINDGMTQLTESIRSEKGEVSPSEMQKASKVIEDMAKTMPPMLEAMAKLVDVLIEKVGKASDVNMAAESLKAIPNLLEGVLTLQAFSSVGLGLKTDSFGLQNNAILQSLNGLTVFLKVLNGGVVDTLINDANVAVNKLSALDQVLMRLAQSFMSIGNNMQAIGQLGTQVSAAGINIATTAPQVAGTVNGQTAPGGGTGQQVQMQVTAPSNSNAEVVAQLAMVTAALGALAGIESGAASTLIAIESGINSGAGKKAAKSIGSTSSMADISLGGNSSDPTYAVGYNGGQPK